MDTRGVEITWLGHAAFRVRSGGKIFYVDPFLEQNPKCPESEKRPDHADVILVTHAHFDHAGDLVALARRTHAQVVAIHEIGQWLGGRGVARERILGMNKGGTVSVAGAQVTMVHAVHSSSVEENGAVHNLGEAAGFVVAFPEGLRVYFSGDTAAFGDMRLIGELFQPELAVLPIGGFYTMDPRQAAYACRLLGVKAVVPMHFGTFPALSGTPAELRRHLDAACEMVELTPGKVWK